MIRKTPITVKSHRQRMGVVAKIMSMPWVFVLCVLALAGIGFVALYSAAGGDWNPWAKQQFIRFLPGFVGMLIVAVLDLKWVYRLAYPFWFLCMGLLVLVEFIGFSGMGAQRWLNLGVMNLQPSDLAKIAVIVALARYYHAQSFEEIKKIRTLLVPLVLTLAPVSLIVMQPDLGTSLMLVMAAAAVIFIVGTPWWLFAGGLATVAAGIPVGFRFLHEYQQRRVMTFLNPESDPLGAGYHITQSKIAIGSGGLEGKGYLQGSQSNLNFLPEKHTDFIFTLIAEEWGLLGAGAILALVAFILYQGYRIAFRARQPFGRIMALGLITNFAIYIVVNVGMVIGLLPVVGAPFPLISYGGTAMMTMLLAFGLIMCVSNNRNQTLPRG